MATPQQPPQQPIYPQDLSLALDRNFTKLTSYTNARYEELAAQVRVGNSESLARDTDLAKQIQIGNEESLRRDTDLANAILQLTERVSNIDKRLSDVETFQKTLLETYQTTTNTILKSLADSHAALMEQINQLKRPPEQPQ